MVALIGLIVIRENVNRLAGTDSGNDDENNESTNQSYVNRFI